jgi:hypothetical protein
MAAAIIRFNHTRIICAIQDDSSRLAFYVRKAST